MAQQSTPNNQTTNKKTDWLTLAKEAITLISSALAILVGLIWYLGRRATAGRFSAYNIPLDMVDFSIWEYGEQSIGGLFLLLIGLIFSLAIMMACIGYINNPKIYNINISGYIKSSFYIFLFIIIILLYYWVDIGISRFFIILALLFLLITISYDKKRNGVFEKNIVWFCFVIFEVMFLVVVLDWSSNISRDEGRKSGSQYINSRVINVRVILDKPLISDAVKFKEIKINDITLYMYENIYLITQNNQRYFFFDELDSSCRPKRVYVVRESDVQSLEYTVGPPLIPNCTSLPTTMTIPAPAQYLPLLQSPTVVPSP